MNTDSWTIGFYADGPWRAGKFLQVTTLPASQVQRRQIGIGYFGTKPQPVYEFMPCCQDCS